MTQTHQDPAGSTGEGASLPRADETPALAGDQPPPPARSPPRPTEPHRSGLVRSDPASPPPRTPPSAARLRASTRHTRRSSSHRLGRPLPFPTRDGAEPAQPGNRRRWTELTAVAVLAALLASGGTYAATQLD